MLRASCFATVVHRAIPHIFGRTQDGLVIVHELAGPDQHRLRVSAGAESIGSLPGQGTRLWDGDVPAQPSATAGAEAPLKQSELPGSMVRNIGLPSFSHAAALELSANE